ncbi:MAG: MgtC/SapB family protein [Leptolyngbyaceae cyanobacterium bins.349]|nr:MgtC/SapB family protein [Leptolyngbyaceae cyanobacterium bins.349]
MSNVLTVSPENWVELTIRLGLAMFLGGAIGWERQASGKAGGLRTHMLVSLGAALFILVPLQTGASEDSVSRGVQGIATGVGFLGAGEIVHRSLASGKPQVKGLTSAASIWVTAAVGVLAGLGLWQTCVIATLLTLLVLIVVRWLERILPTRGDDQ